MVIDYLKVFTFLSREEIEELAKIQKEHPENREAQKVLAREIITFLHGEEEAKKAEVMSKSLFSEEIINLSSEDILNNFKDIEKYYVKEDIVLEDLIVNNEICSSKREARELIKGNAISLNNCKINDNNYVVTKNQAIDKKVYLLKKGKKKYYLIIFE